MDGRAPGWMGPCHECGQPLPAGTQRYCVHCGAEVVEPGEPAEEQPGEPTWFDGSVTRPVPLTAFPRTLSPRAPMPVQAPPAAGTRAFSQAPVESGASVESGDVDTPAAGSRRPTTWSFGDFRAPAPTDSQGLALPPEPPPGVEWNGPGEVTVALPPAPAADPVPPPGTSWFEGEPHQPQDDEQPQDVEQPLDVERAQDVEQPLDVEQAQDDGQPQDDGRSSEDRQPQIEVQQQPASPTPLLWAGVDPAALDELMPLPPPRPMSAGPVRLEIAYPPDPIADDSDDDRRLPTAERATAAAPAQAPPAVPGALPPWPPSASEPAAPGVGLPPRAYAQQPLPGPGPGPSPADSAAAPRSAAVRRGVDLRKPGPALPLDPWDFSANVPWNGPPNLPGPERPARRNRAVGPTLVAAGLVLVAVTAAVLVWSTSRGGDNLAATNSSSGPSGVSATGPAPLAATSSAPGDVTPRPTGASGTASTSPTASVSASASVSGSGTPAAAFAGAMNGLLDESTSARTSVSSTVAALESCRTSATKAATALRSASKARSDLATRAGALNSAAVTGGSDAVSAFVAMQQASAAADDAFAAWADDVAASGCRTAAPHTAHWTAGDQHSAEATTAKSRFVGLWNPIATANDMPARTTDGI